MKSHCLSESDRHGIAKLSHHLGPRSLKYPIIGKGLEAGAFPYRKVSHLVLGYPQHVLPARHSVVARFERFRGLVQVAAGMPCVAARSWNVEMVGEFRTGLQVKWIGQAGNRVSHSPPGLPEPIMPETCNPLKARPDRGRRFRARLFCNFMPIPIFTVTHL